MSFAWKEPSEHTGPGTHYGFIAQDVERVFPNWVGKDDKGFKTLDTHELDALLLESVRNLKAQNDDLQRRVRVLEATARPEAAAGLGGQGIAGLLSAAGLVAALFFSRRREQKY